MMVLQGQNIKHNIVNKLTENNYLKKEKIQPVNPDTVLKPRVAKKRIKKDCRTRS